MSETTHFEAMGLPIHYPVDNATLSARYRALQKEVHPDRFVGQAPAMQALAAQYAARVNAAYQLLGDPLACAAYWLSLHTDEAAVAPLSEGFLMEQLSWREAMEAATTHTEKLALCQKVQQEVLAAKTDFDNLAMASPLMVPALRQALQRWKFMQQMALSFEAEVAS